MKILITGGAGFVGPNLIKKFLNKRYSVFCIDNYSRGCEVNIKSFFNNNNFKFLKCDVSDYDDLEKVLNPIHKSHGIDEVWHLAANSDIPSGVKYMKVDYKDTFMTTYNIIKWMKHNNVENIYFSSSSAIYGDHGDKSIREETGPLLPHSNYGAMKLASEALISSSSQSFLKTAIIFRFPNVVGIPATHGVIFDFFNKLKIDSENLNVLGNGTQKKSYLHVEELIDAMLFVREILGNKGLNVFNIGPDMDDGVEVKTIAEEVVKSTSYDCKIIYGKGNKGWVGDIPKFNYSIEKIKNLGWKPKLNSHQTILKAIKQIKDQIL